MKRLLLTNGHGEDHLAAALVGAWPGPDSSWSALPLVGQGRALAPVACLLGPCQEGPSGGFWWGRPRATWGQLRAGGLGDAWARWRALAAWVQAHPGGAIVSVGDLIPLAMAWQSGLTFVHFDSAKSVRMGHHAPFLPPELGLMASPRCRALALRDEDTAAALRARGVAKARCWGNPMAEALAAARPHQGPGGPLLILPGSRWPEAQGHLARALGCLPSWAQAGLGPFRVALAPDLAPRLALPQGWSWGQEGQLLGPGGLKVAAGALVDMAPGASMALATAGTATEQAVGMGLPAVLWPGPGPQFTPRFARAQARLLGPAAVLVGGEEEARAQLLAWARGPEARSVLGRQGKEKMGPPGASGRMAAAFAAALWEEPCAT